MAKSAKSAHDRIVFRTLSGKWANMRLGARRAASLHANREQAIMFARLMLLAAPGARLIVKLT
jgi:hypothetical protein